jgi:DNA-binding NtrC family response regulator
MKDQTLNLFIIDHDKIMAKALQTFLIQRFKRDLKITTFNSGNDAIKSINAGTDIVILDYNLKYENGIEILKEIKLINPSIEVIMLTSNEDISIAIESFRKGATDYVIKGNSNAWKKLADIVYKIIIYPVHLMVREFRISKYLAIFLLVFSILGIIAFLTMKLGV